MNTLKTFMWIILILFLSNLSFPVLNSYLSSQEICANFFGMLISSTNFFSSLRFLSFIIGSSHFCHLASPWKQPQCSAIFWINKLAKVQLTFSLIVYISLTYTLKIVLNSWLPTKIIPNYILPSSHRSLGYSLCKLTLYTDILQIPWHGVHWMT